MPFAPDLAKLTVQLSRDTYRSRERARTDTAALGLADFHWFTGRSTQAFAAADAALLYVAFRGTEANPIDWTQNAKFNPMVGELEGRVHSGFHSGVAEVWDSLLVVVAAAGKPVVLTGHSLGGALATLAAARLHEAGHPVVAVYTFGQPRVGHGDFSSGYEGRLAEVTYRLINHIDLVTRVPLLLQRYRHVGLRVYFDADGTAHVGASILKIVGEDVKFRLAHWGRIQAAGLAPHGIAAYVNLVEAL
jgi:triacylglycerol lipase